MEWIRFGSQPRSHDGGLDQTTESDSTRATIPSRPEAEYERKLLVLTNCLEEKVDSHQKGLVHPFTLRLRKMLLLSQKMM